MPLNELNRAMYGHVFVKGLMSSWSKHSRQMLRIRRANSFQSHAGHHFCGPAPDISKKGIA